MYQNKTVFCLVGVLVLIFFLVKFYLVSNQFTSTRDSVVNVLLKLINNSSSKSKENHSREGGLDI